MLFRSEFVVMETAPVRLHESGCVGEVFGEDLVHRDRRTQNGGAHERDPGDLEQTLERSVLTHRTMQQGQDDHVAGEHAERIDARTDDVDGVTESSWIDGAACPCTVAGDADGIEFVAVRIGGAQHVTGGDPGDVVFGRPPAEQDDQTSAGRSGHGGHRSPATVGTIAVP